MYDAVVIGAGPAGLSAAAEIAASGKRCVVLDQGKALSERDRYQDLLSGVGGAGLFSDGKHSFFPSATHVWRLPDRARLTSAYEKTCALLAKHNVPTPLPSEQQNETTGSSWHLKRYPSIYASYRDREACIAELYDECGELPWLNAKVTNAKRSQSHGQDLISLEVDQRNTKREIETRQLIIATGRLSPYFIRPWLEPLGVTFAFRRLEFGVRLETPSNSKLFAELEGVDPKLTLDDPQSTATRFLTFCTCRDGEVVLGSLENLHAFSGRADGPKTNRSSIGLLTRVTDQALAATIAPFLFRAAPLQSTLADRSLENTFGPEGAAILERALALFTERFPIDPSTTTIHAPCIEGVGDYPVASPNLELAENIFIAGDACGLFRGIVASMVSGRYVGGLASK